MTRLCILGLIVFFAAASSALGQEAWPTYPIDGHNLERGAGGYLSIVKLGLIWVLFLLWVKTTDWVNVDAQQLNLDYLLWNPIVFFPFLAIFLVVTLSVAFPIGYGLLVISWIGPLGAYIYQRNSNVESHETVMTPAHFRYLIGRLSGLDTEKKAAYERGAPVTFTATGAETEAKNQANMIKARQSEGFVMAKDMVADAIDRRSDKIMMDFEAEQVAVRYQIDGAWHEVDPLERESGDLVLEALKRLANANPDERRKRQSGGYRIAYKDFKLSAKLETQGTKTGERAIMHLQSDRLKLTSLSEAGMRPKMQEQLKELLATPKGIFVFCSVPGGGLSTTMALAGNLCDRYMRDFTSFQDETNPEPVAENIEIERYHPDKDSVTERLTTVMRKDPDVLIYHEIDNKDVLQILCERTSENKLIITSIRAKEAVEALLRVLLLKVPAKVVAPVLLGVLNQRLVRVLCEDCKEEYVPSPDMLKKLGIPAGRVDVLYREPEVDEDQPVCKTCGGIGFLGRTSIFELLPVDDALREALIKQPKLDVLRKVARQSGNRTLREEGIVLVAKGITSVHELTRALKV